MDMTNESVLRVFVEPDLLNLKNQDIEKIIRILDLSLREDTDNRQQLVSRMNLILDNIETREILIDKLFAGRTSVRWYRIELNDDNHKDEIIKLLKGDKYCFESRLSESFEDEEDAIPFVTEEVSEGIFLMRVLIKGSSRKINTGVSFEITPTFKNIICIVNLNEEYIEIRGSNRDANKIHNVIFEPLFNNLRNNQDTLYLDCILCNSNNDMEDFKDKLNNGKFIDVKSIPEMDLSLTDEESEILVDTLRVLDAYYISKDINEMIESLRNIDISNMNFPFTQLLLGGLSVIGLGMNEDIRDDLSNQLLYNMLKPHIENQSGFITFNLPDDLNQETITIQVGLKTDTINFRSSSSEDSIKYVREIILDS